MKKRITEFLLGVCLLSIAAATTVSAAPFTDDSTVFDSSDAFSDGATGITALANTIVEMQEQEAGKYKATQYVAEKTIEAKKKSEEIKRQKEEARRRAEEIKRKAEEARKKREEEKKKKEEARIARRQSIVDFALQFEGNPYVYGGTSLTNGADCSGFVMSVFANFGVELPRVAAAQCSASTKKDAANIEPGDLVFYGDYGIDHVALYIGNGKIIHASTAATGIKISDYNYRAPAAIGTFIE